MQTAPGLRPRLLFVGFVTMCLLWGCGQPAREDRSIHFSSDGGQVGFQHGNEGVFLANPAGGPPRKIFQPSADVIAVSTPLVGKAPAARRSYSAQPPALGSRSRLA